MVKTIKKKLLENMLNNTKRKLNGAKTSYDLASTFDSGDLSTDKYIAESQKKIEIQSRNSELNKLQLEYNFIKNINLKSNDPDTDGLVLYELSIPLNGNKYLALNKLIAGDSYEIDNNRFFLVTPNSPVGKELIESDIGDEFAVNFTDYQIKSIK